MLTKYDRLISWLTLSVGTLSDEFLFFVFDLNIVKSLVSAEDKGRLCSLNTLSTISPFWESRTRLLKTGAVLKNTLFLFS